MGGVVHAKYGHNECDFLAQLLEDTRWEPNGELYLVNPETVGALTDSPILTDELDIGDDGTVEGVGNLWWFPNYMVIDFAHELVKNGAVTLQKADAN